MPRFQNTPLGIDGKGEKMCRATKCRTCGKTTWAGCGQHVSSVRASVPASQWCNGNHTRGEIQAAQTTQSGFFSRLFGR